MGKVSRPAHHTQKTLAAVCDDIRAALAGVQTQLQLMQAVALDAITVEAGQAEMVRGLVGINNFAMSVDRAVRNARTERGDFGVEPDRHGERDRDKRTTPEVAPKKRRRPPKKAN